MPIKAKQVEKVQAASVRVNGLSANGASNTVTTQIGTALSTAGAGGISVPLQASNAEGLGVITTGLNNRVDVYASTSRDKFVDSAGEEVYARLTETSGTYTLTYFTFSNAGQETPYTFASPTVIDFEFNYRFDFWRVPTDAIVAVNSRNVNQDPTSSSGKPFAELLTVTGANTFSKLTKTPISVATFSLEVNNATYDTFGGSDALYTVDLATKTVNWNPAAKDGFPVVVGERVVARYFTFD